MTRLLYTPEWIEAQHALKNAFEAAGLNKSLMRSANWHWPTGVGSKYPDQDSSGLAHAASHGDQTPQRHLRPRAARKSSRWRKKKAAASLICSGARTSSAGPAGRRAAHYGRQGRRLINAMRDAGFDSPHQPLRSDIAPSSRSISNRAAKLETEGKTIGVVTSIVGQRRYDVRLQGANHAGTTPMSYRRDTVHAFSRICCESIAKRAPRAIRWC